MSHEAPAPFTPEPLTPAQIDAEIAAMEAQFQQTADTPVEPLASVEGREVNDMGEIKASEQQVAIESLEGITSFDEKVYSDGTRHVYGKTEDGKSVHLKHDTVLAAYGHAGDTQGKAPVEVDTDDPEEFFNTWGMTPQEFDALPKDQQVQVLAGRNSASPAEASSTVSMEDALWSTLPEATQRAWTEGRIDTAEKDRITQDFSRFWQEVPVNLQQQWTGDSIDSATKADLFRAYLAQGAAGASEAQAGVSAEEARAAAIEKRKKKLWSIVNNPDSKTLDQINAQAELVRLDEPAELRRYDLESDEVAAEQKSERQKVIDELVRSREAVVWSTGASSDPEGDKLRQDRQITQLFGMTPKEFDRFIHPMYKSEDDPAVITALENELLLRSLGHQLDQAEKALADPTISAEDRAFAEQKRQGLLIEQRDAADAELVLLPRKRRVGRSAARAVLGPRPA